MSYNREEETPNADAPAASGNGSNTHPHRVELVDEKLQLWASQLYQRIAQDVSNNYLELSAAHPTGLAQLYTGRPTRLANLVREPRALAHCRIRAREVMNAAKIMEDRYGVGPVYLALGTASWRQGGQLGAAWDRATASSRPLSSLPEGEQNPDLALAADHAAEQYAKLAGQNAASVPYDFEKVQASTPTTVSGPALLCPLRLSLSEDDDVILTLEHAVQVWPPLAAALRQRGEQGELANILQLVRGRGAEPKLAASNLKVAANGFSPTVAIPALRELGQASLLGFDLYESLTVGQYLHPVTAVLEDLQLSREAILENDIVAALCGDVNAAGKVLQPMPAPVETDRDPKVEHGVGDLDPAQHNALDGIAAGAHVLLDAPPGSESVATVSAILADAATAGRTIAYVPGDRRRANQTMQRLSSLGLSQMFLDLTSIQGMSEAKDRFLQALNTQVLPEDPQLVADRDQMREELSQVRAQLGGYMEQLHKKRLPWGVSAYDALQVLADLTALKPGPRTKVRFDLDTLHQIASDGAERAQQILQEAFEAGILNETRATNPWFGIVVASTEMVQSAVQGVRQLSAESLPSVRADIDRTVKETGLKRAVTLNQWRDQLQMLQGVRQAMDVFKPQIFERSAADMVIATAPKKWRKERALNMKESLRRRLVKQAKDYVRPGRKVQDLHKELIRVQQQRQIWREYTEAGGWPVLPGGMDQMLVREQRLRDDLREVQAFFSTGYGTLELRELDELNSLMDQLARDEVGAQRLPQRVAILKEIRDYGLDELVEDLRERRVPQDLIRLELDLAWWASALAEILQLDSRLSHFDGAHLEQLAGRLRYLDQQQVDSLPGQVAYQLQDQTASLVKTRVESGYDLAAAIEDTSITLLEIYQQFPLAHRLIPVKVIPPVLIPEVLPAEDQTDLLVLDGVDNSELVDLVPAIVRARQVVVVGDARRAPSGTITDFAGVFPQLTIPPTRTRTNEWVASFLAEQDYGQDVLAVTPPKANHSITLELVDGRGMPAPGAQSVETSKVEVERVRDLVVEHALRTPEISLAVVALNQRHAQRISEAIMTVRARTPEVDGFFSPNRKEPFVVVEAAKATGIRRDNVILSVGYAKTPHNRVLYDFGILSTAQGSTYLVDALTTVRNQLTLVSSVDPEELDPFRLRTNGTRMLQALLLGAKSSTRQVSPIEAAQLMDEEESQPDRLLIDLAERLYSVGLTVIPNLGPKQGMKIPLAIGHPEYPDELLVAVLTDNAKYAAEKSLRRRERHWIQRLESYGWQTITVYSTSVFMDLEQQAQRILDLVVDIVEERQRAEKAAQAPDPQLLAESGLAGQNALLSGAAAAEPGDGTGVFSEGEVALAQVSAGSPLAEERPSAGEVQITVTGEQIPVGVRELDRPPIARGLPLAAYGDDQIDDVLAWIRSDHYQRSEDQEVELLRDELGLREGNSQVNLILRNAVRR